MKNTPEHLCILESYPRAVAHLRSQVQKSRFGLILGAGVSREFNVPLWKDLVADIAKDPRVSGTDLISGAAAELSHPYRTEMLFQRFRTKTLGEPTKQTTLAQENCVTAAWHNLCREKIYGTKQVKVEDAFNKHPYMNALVPLVQGSSLTISFNFDDFLERSLAHKNTKGGRGFETVTDPWPQFRRTDSVVYHPHGFVPSGIMEGAVDRFVFSEAGYSKQYVGANGHDASFLTAHFARNTCLLVGCSLEGELRTVLMRGAQMNPGNYHYYVHHLGPEAVLNVEERSLIAETNFKVYNLNTLFLNSAQIALLLQVINPDTITDQSLRDDASLCLGGKGVPLKYTFYLTGPIGVGKSTTANLLRSLTVLDEWHEARPDDLAKPWDTLSKEERVRTDEWIAGQFKLKNTVLRHNQGPVIHVVDRPPLDPLIFAKPEDRAAKSKSLLETICPSAQFEIEKGVVILLLGIPEELSARVVATGRQEYTAEKLQDMQEKLIDIYDGRPGVITISAKFLSIPELTRRVAQIIHRDDYKPADLMEMMRSHQQPIQVVSHESA